MNIPPTPESQKEAARRLRWHMVAKKLLGDCACQPEFISRNLFDPDCLLHQNMGEMIEALSAEYLQGCADQRFAWASRLQARHA